MQVRPVRAGRGTWAALVLSLLLVVVLCGCSATAQVSVVAHPNGTGAVSVAVTLDKAATAAVGDVATELQTSDLVAAGWAVSGPTTEAGGSTVIRATKPFATLAQASSIVQEIAGSGPAPSRPFQLAITRHRTFWKTTTTLSGDVNLGCGLDCFGDSGLQSALGSPTGINPASEGAGAAGIFHFAMAVSLPGKVHSTNASVSTYGRSSSPAGSSSRVTVLHWTPRLGAEVPLMAVTETTDTAHVDEVVAACGAALFLLVALVVWWIVHRWRKRRRGRGASAPTGGSPAGGRSDGPAAPGAGEPGAEEPGGRRPGRRRRPAHARKGPNPTGADGT